MLGIIAAGGLGTRMGSDLPKPLTLLPSGKTFLSTAIEKLIPQVDEIAVVTSMAVQNHKNFFRDERCNYRIQMHPTGMGDAVFSAADLIAVHEDVLILWCDQVGITEQTISNTIAAHKSLEKDFKCTIPLVTKSSMYTHFEFRDGHLENVFQAREGDSAPEPCNSDVGLFLCTGGKEFITAWIDGGREFSRGRSTLEYNFIPFLKFLGTIGWAFRAVEAQEMDGVGVNNPNELHKAYKRLIQ
jgi:bifunctional N-acetylglucosamine-1-phosphate-uridyltransferase/glucosamine-1-phosphate-acetyltransferase GlmU-like protein